jgi:hypothetical protein
MATSLSMDSSTTPSLRNNTPDYSQFTTTNASSASNLNGLTPQDTPTKDSDLPDQLKRDKSRGGSRGNSQSSSSNNQQASNIKHGGMGYPMYAHSPYYP